MLDFFASNRLSVFNIGILMNPNNCKENIMIIIPAMSLNVSEFFNKAWLKKDADAPSKMKTVEKPKQNKTNGIIFTFLLSKISFNDWPEIKDMYPGIKGKTHGDKKLIKPAPKAMNNSNIYPVFFIAAEIPAIDVKRASSKYFLSRLFFFVFSLLITIGWIIFSTSE